MAQNSLGSSILYTSVCLQPRCQECNVAFETIDAVLEHLTHHRGEVDARSFERGGVDIRDVVSDRFDPKLLGLEPRDGRIEGSN